MALGLCFRQSRLNNYTLYKFAVKFNEEYSWDQFQNKFNINLRRINACERIKLIKDRPLYKNKQRHKTGEHLHLLLGEFAHI